MTPITRQKHFGLCNTPQAIIRDQQCHLALDGDSFYTSCGLAIAEEAKMKNPKQSMYGMENNPFKGSTHQNLRLKCFLNFLLMRQQMRQLPELFNTRRKWLTWPRTRGHSGKALFRAIVQIYRRVGGLGIRPLGYWAVYQLIHLALAYLCQLWITMQLWISPTKAQRTQLQITVDRLVWVSLVFSMPNVNFFKSITEITSQTFQADKP